MGQQVGDAALILEGLKAGERIVVEGVQKLREGILVQPRTAAELAAAAAAAGGTASSTHPE